MTEDEKKKMLAGFQQPVPEDEDSGNDWTDEEILEHAKRIMKKLGIEGEFCDGKEM